MEDCWRKKEEEKKKKEEEKKKKEITCTNLNESFLRYMTCTRNI